MVERCTINVGFHSNFGTLRQSRNSKTPLRLAIINGMPFNPTYELSHLVKYFPLMAGGDVQVGQAIGETDDIVSAPVGEGFTPDDLAASFFRNIGIGPQTKYQTNVGRPVTLVRDGRPIQQLF